MMLTELQPNHQLFFRFLKLTHSVKRNHRGSELTPNEIQLLHEVSLRDFENRALSVRQALSLHHLGSPATLHKRIKHLRYVGLLSFKQVDTDHRTKYLIPTRLALQHFERMGEVMHQALQG